MSNEDTALSALPSQLQSSMYKSDSSTSLSLLSTNSDYQQRLVGGSEPRDEEDSTLGQSRPRTPDREISPVEENIVSNDSYIESFSRPLSRNSTTSYLSTTATKDGIEGNRLHRHGPTSYSNNIISNMVNANNNNNNLATTNSITTANNSARPQITSPLAMRVSGVTSPPIIATSPVPVPQTDDETSPISHTPSSPGDKLNFANMELHNSIFKKQIFSGLAADGIQRSSSLLSATNDEDYEVNSIANNYSQVSIKTTNAQVDGDSGASNHITGLVSAPLITLREKINLLDTGAVERQDNF